MTIIHSAETGESHCFGDELHFVDEKFSVLLPSPVNFLGSDSSLECLCNVFNGIGLHLHEQAMPFAPYPIIDLFQNVGRRGKSGQLILCPF
jgi:hypothetical protein